MNLAKQAQKIGRRAVLVKWIDSCGPEGWTAASDESSVVPAAIWTLGWLLRDEKDFVLLAGTATAAHDESPQSSAPIAVPRCSILKMTYLTPEKS